MKNTYSFEVMGYIAPSLVEKAGRYRRTTSAPSARRNITRYGVIAASLLLAVGIFLTTSSLREDLDFSQKGGAAQDSHGTAEAAGTWNVNYSGSFSDATKVFEAYGILGEDSVLFTREFEDFTYDLDYLTLSEGDVAALVSTEAAERWMDSVYLKKSDEAQKSLPLLYQAVRELGIEKDSFMRLNEERVLCGSDMALPEATVEALYSSEDTARRLLVNPLSLYYSGDIYTWTELRDMTVETAMSEGMPEGVIYEYVGQTVNYCVEQAIISEEQVSVYLDKYSDGPQYADPPRTDEVYGDKNCPEADGASAGREGTFILEAENILQKPCLPNGCEVVSLAIVLEYYGISVDPVWLYDYFMPKAPLLQGDPELAYVGDAKGNGLGCYASCLTATGNEYLSSIDSELAAENVSGMELSYYESLVREGVPVILWGLKDMVPDGEVYKQWEHNGKSHQWLKNSHCLVLIGTTDTGYIFCDPLVGVCEYPRDRVETCFALNGRRACIIK